MPRPNPGHPDLAQLGRKERVALEIKILYLWDETKKNLISQS